MNEKQLKTYLIKLDSWKKKLFQVATLKTIFNIKNNKNN